MTTTEINGTTYAIGSLAAKKAIHVARHLTPLISTLLPHLGSLQDKTLGPMDKAALVIPDMAAALASLSDADCDYVIDHCLAVCKVKQDTGWANLVNAAGGYQFPIDAVSMLKLTGEVVRVNLAGFFPTVAPLVSAATPTISSSPASSTERTGSSDPF